MKIAVISMIRDSWGGSEELWYQMALQALRNDHEVLHVGYQMPEEHPKITELKSLGLKRILRPNSSYVIGVAKRALVQGINFLRKKINDPIKSMLAWRPDVVVYNGTNYSIANEISLLACLSEAEKNFRFFYIGHLCNDWYREINETEAQRVRFAYTTAEKVFFVSERNKMSTERQLAVAIPNGVLIRNPVNLNSIDAIPFPQTEPVQMASVGNLITRHKGQDLLFHALHLWNEKNWQLNVYGSGPDNKHLQNLAIHYKLQKQIFFHGHVKDIRSVWEKNQLLLIPSLVEGMPLAIVEAMLCGRVVVATDTGGAAEWINDEETGFLCRGFHPEAIKATLIRAWDRKKDWQIIAEAAHQRASALYEPEAGKRLLQYLLA